MAGINVPFIADVARWLKGTRSVEDSLDDVADSLDDLARETTRSADRAGDALEDSLTDAAAESTKASERLEDNYRDALRQVSRSSEDAGKNLGDNMRRGADDADEGIKSLKENTAQNAKEMGASFTDVTSALDAVQGLAAEALEGFGPAGVAAGVAVAAGIGLITVALEGAAEKANTLTEDAADLAAQMAETDTAGRVQVLADRWAEVSAEIADVRSLWEVWQPRGVTLIEEFATAARDAGVDIRAIYEAFNEPDPATRLTKLRDALTGVQRAGQGTRDEANHLTGSMRRAGESMGDYSGRLANTVDALDATEAALRDEIATQEAATAVTRAMAEAKGQTVAAYEAEQQAIADAQAAHDAYGAALEATADPVSTYEGLLADKEAAERATAEATAAATKDATDSWEDYARDVAVTIDDLINDWVRQQEAAARFETNLAAIAAAGGQALADELRAKGPEAAGAVADVIANASPEKQREAITAHARATGAAMGTSIAAGITGSRAAAQTAIDALIPGLRVPGIGVRLTPDTADLDRELAKPRTIKVGVAARPGQQVVI